MAERSAVIDKVDAVRNARSEFIADATRMPLAQAIRAASSRSTWPLASTVRVVKLLDTHPCLGKVAGRRLMATLGIGAFATYDQLDPGLVQRVQESCRCPHG